MPDEEDEEKQGKWAVSGEESPEWDSTLSPDDGGDDPREPPSEPKQPSPPKPER
jgi:hypothetical protein